MNWKEFIFDASIRELNPLVGLKTAFSCFFYSPNKHKFAIKNHKLA